jgi:hypothetical protein
MNRIPAALAPKFAEAVLSQIAGRRAHKAAGNRDDEESLSFLRTCLEEKGWKNLGHASDFEDALTAAGFALREVFVGRGSRRVYVGV